MTDKPLSPPEQRLASTQAVFLGLAKHADNLTAELEKIMETISEVSDEIATIQLEIAEEPPAEEKKE